MSTGCMSIYMDSKNSTNIEISNLLDKNRLLFEFIFIVYCVCVRTLNRFGCVDSTSQGCVRVSARLNRIGR